MAAVPKTKGGSVVRWAMASALLWLACTEVLEPRTPLAMASGALSSTRPLATPRADHTATLLPNGKVLVAGGDTSGDSQSDGGGTPTATAEVYDPETEKWESIAPMKTARYFHTAMLLPHGKVLVTGGYGADSVRLNSAEVYDPGTGVWSSVAAMATPRTKHTATLLPDGKVLVAGGRGQDNHLTSTEVYDPDTDTWSLAASMNMARGWHTATLLLNGKVLVAGGYNPTKGHLNTAEVYDPGMNTWSLVSAMQKHRERHTATLLPSGKVLVTGGYNHEWGPIYHDTAEIYDPVKNTWRSTTQSMTKGRASHTATRLPNGKVLVIGGYNSNDNQLNRMEVYDPDKESWHEVGSLSNVHNRHTATLLPSGKLLVTAGYASTVPSANTDLYDPGPNRQTGSLATTRHKHTSTLLPDGTVLVAGGDTSNTSTPSASAAVEVYDPATGKWKQTGLLKQARYWHTATVLPSGKVLISGGFSAAATALASAEVYDPVTGSSTTGPMAHARGSHTATLLASGKVLVSGGLHSGSSITNAEVYDPGTGQWSSAGALAVGRDRHTATLLPNGKVLVSGGYNHTNTELASAEVYDPGDGSGQGVWSLTNPMHMTRSTHTATLLPNGKVLVVGGHGGTNGPRAGAEVYDPDTEQWSSAGVLLMARYFHTATLLPDGKVLISGGDGTSDATAVTAATAEVYDPGDGSGQGAWSLAGSLDMARTRHTATLLPDGKVLLTGGQYGSATLASAEVYAGAPGVSRPAGPLSVARTASMAVHLPTGQVLLTGGSGSNGPVADAELYTPATRTWAVTASMGTPRSLATATLLPTSEVLVVGGQGQGGGNKALGSAELFNPVTKAWRPTNSLNTPRHSHSALLLRTGEVLVTGGLDAEDAPVSTLEVYNPRTGAWRQTSPMLSARREPLVVQLPGGKVLAAGGRNTEGTLFLASAELYDLETDVWTETTPMGTARASSTAVLLHDGQVLVAGGLNGSGALSSAEVYNENESAERKWTAVGPLGMARKIHAAHPLPTGQVLVLSEASATSSLANVEVYGPVQKEWGSRAPLREARKGFATVMLPSGQVLVMGGEDAKDNLLVSTEEYDSHTLRPVVNPVAAQKPGDRIVVVQGKGFLDSRGDATLVRLWTSPGGELKSLPVEELSSTSLRVTLPEVPEGHHLLFVRVNGVTGGQVVHVDGTPPGAPRVLAPAALVNTSRPGVNGSAEPRSTVQVVLDGTEIHTATVNDMGAWEVPQAHVRELADGAHTLRATATDMAKNTGGASEIHFTVDTTPPEAPVVLEPANGSVTPARRPVYRGRAAVGSTVTVFVDDKKVGTTRADDEGQWSFSQPADLVDTHYKVSAWAMDVAGNTGPASSPITFTVDTTPPEAPEVLAPADNARTQYTQPTYSGRAEKGSTVTVFVDDKKVGTTLADASGTWSLSQPTVLEEGPHTVRAQAMDEAGNPSEDSNSNTFTVDITPPEAPEVLEPADGLKTRSTGPTYRGTAEVGSTVTVVVNGIPVGTTLADALGQWSLMQPGELVDGLYRVKARARDVAGNVGDYSSPITFTVDTTPPEAPVVLTPADNSPTQYTQPTYSGRAEAGSTVTVFVDGVAVGTTVADASGNWSFSQRVALGGSHTVSARAMDAAGNEGPGSSPNTFTVDTLPPEAPVVLAPADNELTNDPTPTYSGTAEAGSTVTVFVDDKKVGTALADASGTWSLSQPTALGEGPHTVRAQAMDMAGNPSEDSNSNTFTVDTTTPAPVVLAPADNGLTNDPTPTYSGTAEAGSTVTVFVDDKKVGTALADASGTWSLSQPTALGEGSHTVSARAVDVAGNAGASSPNTFKVDTTTSAPEVLAPANNGLTNEPTPTYSGRAEAGSTVTVFVDEEVVGTAPADDEGKWSLSQPTALGERSYTVSAQAVDVAGNPSEDSNSNTFTVDITPPEAPEVLEPDIGSTGLPTYRGTAEAGSTVTVFVDDKKVGDVLVDKRDWRFSPPDALKNGLHTVKAQARDKAGNASPYSKDIKVDTRVSHFGWGSGCTTAPALPATWALLTLAWSLGRRRRSKPHPGP